MALTLFRGIGARSGQASALNGLGEAARAGDEPIEALTQHTAALAVATEIGARDQEARAHAGIGHAHRVLGDTARACQHYEQALSCYTDLNSPQAEDIRAYLIAG